LIVLSIQSTIDQHQRLLFFITPSLSVDTFDLDHHHHHQVSSSSRWMLEHEINTTVRFGGSWKSFFYSKTDPRYGYLIAYNQRFMLNTTRQDDAGRVGVQSHRTLASTNANAATTDNTQFVISWMTLYDSMKLGWELVQEVLERHNITHLYAEPPKLLSIDKDYGRDGDGSNGSDTATKAKAKNGTSPSSLSWSELLPTGPWWYSATEASSQTFYSHEETKESTVNNKRMRIVVQKCLVAPADTLFVRVKPPMKRRIKQFEEYLREYKHKVLQLQGPSSSLSWYMDQFRNDVKTAKAMLDDYPALKYDFQFLLDGWTGRMYHLDFDRVYQQPNNSTDKAQRIGQRVHKNLDLLMKSVERVFVG